MTRDSLVRETVAGLSWELGSGILKRLLRFVITIFLARLLAPEHFGLFAMGLMVYEFLELFLHLGIETALVQKDKLEEIHRSSAFWIQLLMALLLGGCFSWGAPLVAAFFERPLLVPLIYLLSMNFWFAASYAVPSALVRRNMEFKYRGIIEVAAVIVAGVMAVSMAYRGWGVWSLLANLIGLNLVEATGYWLVSSWRPRFQISREALGELLGVGMGLTGYLAMDYWVRRTDDLLIGKLKGDGALGLYTRAYSLMRLPIRQVTSFVGNVMIPSLAKLQNDQQKTRDVFLRANRLVAFCTLPMMGGLYLTARPFVISVLGRHWVEMVPLLRMLCLAGLVNPLAVSSSWIFESQGETGLQFRWGIVYAAMMLLGFGIGIRWGALGVAAAYTIVIYISWLPVQYLAGSLIDLSLTTYLLNLKQEFLIAALMSAVVWVARSFVSRLSNPLQLILLVSVGCITYVFLAHGINPSSYRELRKFLANRSSVGDS